VLLRSKFFELESRFNGLEIEDDEEGIFNNSLFELSKHDPVSIEGALAGNDSLMNEVDDKIDKVQQIMNTF
jgi:hypothetical protein